MRRPLCAVMTLIVLAVFTALQPSIFHVDLPSFPPPLSATKAPAAKAANASLQKDVRAACRSLQLAENSTSVVSSAFLCRKQRGCAFEVIVKPLACIGQRKVSHNASFSSWVLDHLGPYTFRLRADGPEVIASNGKFDVKSCRYIFSLMVATKGNYNVAIELLYDDFSALDETKDIWPPLRKLPVLAIPSIPETHYHRQQMTLKSTEEFSCDHPVPFDNPQGICSGTELDLGGHWILNRTGGIIFTRVRVKKIQRNPIKFLWALQPEGDYRWVPTACSKRHVDLIAALERLADVKIIVGGDSQLRALYYAMVNSLSGFENDCVRNISTLDGEPAHCISNVKGSQRKRIGRTQIDFLDDHYLDRLSSGRYASYNIVILGFAQHPASKEHWSFDKYCRVVRQRAAEIEKLRKTGVFVVWYLAPQYPHTTNGYPVVVRDWRTDPRLQLFNEFSGALMRQLQIPVVDAYAISTAMSHTSPDQAHFSNFVAAEFVAMVMNAICAKHKC